MKSLIASRRRMLSFLGAAPLAARAAAQATIARLAGVGTDGLGNASHNLLPSGGPDQPAAGSMGVSQQYVPYENRVIAASNLMRVTGIPEVIDVKLRDDARYVTFLDPDIASKWSWSMNVKIAAQRQRNYERAVQRMHRGGAHYRGLSVLKSALGFEWPW